jgi:hypothetical protein
VPSIANTFFARPTTPRLTNIQTGEAYDVPFFPQELNRSIGVRYAKPTPHGASHSRLHYLGTDNQVVQLEFDLFPRLGRDILAIQDFVKFCESLIYGNLFATGEPGGFSTDPPDVHMFWPQKLSMVGRIENFSERVESFFQSGLPRQTKLSMTFVQTPKRRILSDDIRMYGPR